jgi:hypothetical protein
MGNEQTKMDFEGFFSDFDFSRSRKTKVFKEIEHYWFIKILIAWVMEKQGANYEDLLDR